MAEHRISVLVRAADFVSVKGNRGNAVDKHAVKLGSVGSVAVSVNRFLSVDRAVAGRLQHFGCRGAGFFSHRGNTGIQPDLIVFRLGDHREQGFIGAFDILQQRGGFFSAVCALGHSEGAAGKQQGQYQHQGNQFVCDVFHRVNLPFVIGLINFLTET